MASSSIHQHSPADKRALRIRLRKVAGQVQAIEKMVEHDVDCSEVLTQIVSARKALKSFAEVIIQQHTEHCIGEVSDRREGQRRLRKLLTVLQRYVE